MKPILQCPPFPHIHKFKKMITSKNIVFEEQVKDLLIQWKSHVLSLTHVFLMLHEETYKGLISKEQ